MGVVPAGLTCDMMWGGGVAGLNGEEQQHKGSVVLSHWSGGFPGKHYYSGPGLR